MSITAQSAASNSGGQFLSTEDLLTGFDWARTSLGPAELWPSTLRATVNIVADSAVPMLLLWGKQGIAIYNDAYAPLAGDLHPELYGRPIGQFGHSSILLHRNALDAVFRGECISLKDQPMRIRQKERTTDIWLTLDYSPLRAPDGTIGGALCIMKNTTERKKAEQEIRANENRWRSLFEQMQEGFFIGEAIRDEDGHVRDFALIEYNPALKRQMGIAGSQARPKLTDLIPALGPGVIPSMAAALSTGNAVEFEMEFGGSDTLWYEARAQRVTQDRLGVLLLDVTSRKRAEIAIMESEAKFRLLAQSMPNHVWTARASGQIDWFNERVYDFGGLRKGELSGQEWISIIHPDDLSRISEAWGAAVANGHLYKSEVRLRRRDGVYRWHIVRAVPVRNKSGDIKRWIGTNTDIDDQKSAEAALADFAATLEQRVEARTAELLKTQDALRHSQKMEAIGNLTGGIAHDFNNLLQVISGNLHLIAKDMAGHPVLEARLQNAIKGVTRGAKLASQLLTFGRRQPLSPKVLNIGRLIRNMDDILHRALGEAITVETHVDDRLWNTKIDPGNLENAILNLAINARDAMDHSGHVVIEVSNVVIDSYIMQANMEVSAGHYVMVSVRDTGCGMSQSVMEKVFEPFFTTKPEGKGTGLGLSMVYGFVKQSGGHVMIESQEGQGTTIRLYLPRSEGNEESETGSDAELYPVMGGHETILVAEDDEAVRETVVATLADLGYRVLKARDGAAALTVLECGATVDLLFADLIMPGPLKGQDLIEKARRLRPGIGLLLTSGFADPAEAGVDEDGIEILQKPYSREMLAMKVRRCLDALAGPQDDRAAVETMQEPAVPEQDEPQSSVFPSVDGKQVILLCEDDYLIRLTTAEILEDEGYGVLEAGTGAEALAYLSSYQVDAMVTDFGLPDMTGVDLLLRVRDVRPGLPALLATGHVDVGSLPDGPTEQLTKPFADTQLLAAVRRLIEKQAPAG